MKVEQLLDAVVQAWRSGDAHRASAFFASDGVYHEAFGTPIAGREAIFQHFSRFFRDGPLWTFEIDDLLVEANRAAVRYRFALKDADGSWKERAGCALVGLEDGLIKIWREYQG